MTESSIPEFKYIKICAKDGMSRVVRTFTRVGNIKQKFYGDDLYTITFTVYKRKKSYDMMILGILQETMSMGSDIPAQHKPSWNPVIDDYCETELDHERDRIRLRDSTVILK